MIISKIEAAKMIAGTINFDECEAVEVTFSGKSGKRRPKVSEWITLFGGRVLDVYVLKNGKEVHWDDLQNDTRDVIGRSVEGYLAETFSALDPCFKKLSFGPMGNPELYQREILA